MQLCSPLVFALLIAIAFACIFVWNYPSYYILAIGIEPTGMPIGEFYQARTVFDLPPSIQELLNYQYPLAALLALASFGLVYFWLSMETDDRWIIAICCSIAIASIVWLLPVLLLFPIALGLLVWSLLLYKASNYQLLVPYCYCLTISALTAIVVLFYITDAFAVSTG